MLKEYTLKVTVRVGGETEEQCDERLHDMTQDFQDWEITHEEVVGETEKD